MVELKIIFEPKTGQLGVSGPIENKMLCYSLLELAKDQIREFDPKKAQQSILVPQVQINGLQR